MSILEEIQKKGKLVYGPYAADSFFGSNNYQNFDAILATYHDQGLIPFKTLTFGNGAADALVVWDTLEIDAGGELSLFNGSSVDINGVAIIVGEVANNAIVTEQSKGGSYSFNVNSGATLHARFVLFSIIKQYLY